MSVRDELICVPFAPAGINASSTKRFDVRLKAFGEFRFVVHNNQTLKWPRAETPTHYIAMGIDEDLNQAVKIAVQETVAFLMREKGLTKADAYMLASVAVDLRITQLVDRNKGVHAMIPKTIFVQ